MSETAQSFVEHGIEGGKPIRGWTRGVEVDDGALRQLRNVAALPVVSGWVAVMPDVHWGIGATVGSVIPTEKAIIPAAVGVDIGCGMMAVKTSLRASDLPSDLAPLRAAIERVVPHGRTDRGGRGDRGAWTNPPERVVQAWSRLEPVYRELTRRHPKSEHARPGLQLGTLGTGNHFVEVCLDTEAHVWVMLHSGSRGCGNTFGTYFIELAKRDMREHVKNLPDSDLAYFTEGSTHFDDYVKAVTFAQDYARTNRELMMKACLEALAKVGGIPPFQADLLAVNCHHNYVQKETHFGREVFVTRKGAVRAGLGELGIIPGSMGARSFIVRGRGCAMSFESCSHGAGRRHSRGEAKRRFSVEDHVRATAGVECRKDADVIDETPMAYKDIDLVMAAQAELVDVVATLKQVVCVKG